MNRFVHIARAAFLVLGLFASSARAQLYLTEFMALNESTLVDEDGDYSDWIEVYNASSNAVNLEGWYLTDKPSDLEQWMFPSNTLAPGAYRVVFASGKNRAVAGAPLHTSFSLSGTGEYLALVRPDGVTVEQAYAPAYPPQVADVSYGLGSLSSTVTLFQAGAPVRMRVPVDDSQDAEWMVPEFDDSDWLAATNGLGYDSTPDYLPYFATDVHDLMFGQNATIYVRLPFVLANVADLRGATLGVQCDDGFVAYLNGTEVASLYAPDPPAWNSGAAALSDEAQSIQFLPLSIPDASELLRLGTNVVAIQGLNRETNSSDFLLTLRLEAVTRPTPQNGLVRFFQSPSPGAVNGAGANDLGPVFTQVVHTPAQPLPGQSLQVAANIINPAGGAVTAALHYVVMFTNTVTVPMTNTGGSAFAATIPATAYTTGQLVRYFFTAGTTNGSASRWPLADDASAYLGTMVQDTSSTGAVPTLYWFLANPGWHTKTNGGNNLNWTDCHLFFAGVYYGGAQVRVRGNTASTWIKPPFKFEFPSGHFFAWSTNEAPVEEFNLQSSYADKSYVRQLLAWETYRDSGVPSSSAFLLRVQQNGSFYSLATFVEQPSVRYLERNGLDPNGALYKMFNPATSSSSSVEKKTRQDETNNDLKALIDAVQTNQSALARQRYLLDNVDLPKAVNYLAATTLLHDNDHVEKNYYLYRDTAGSGEWTILPWDKDLTFGRNYVTNAGVLNDIIYASNDVVAVGKPWLSPSHPRFGDSDHQKVDARWNRMIDALQDTAVVREMYMRRLRTLMDERLQAPGTAPAQLAFETRIEALRPLIDPLVTLDRARWGNPYGSNQTLTVALTVLTNQYFAPRRRHLYVTHSVTNGNEIPLAQSNAISLRFGALDFAPATSNQDHEYIELVNTNTFAVDLSGWSVSNAVRFTFQPGTVLPARTNLFLSPNQVAFRARPTSPHSNESRFVQGPYSGQLSARGETLDLYNRAGALVTSLSYTGSPTAFQTGLRITEVMYHPDQPAGSPYAGGDMEYLELKNTGSNALNLAGVKFTGGIQYTFPALTLAPSQLVVVVRSLPAFASRYDTNGLRVAGVYTGALDNAGEQIKLEDPQGEPVLEFSYDDLWLPATDGGGFSLTIQNPLAAFDTWDQAASWRPSLIVGGTPGREEPALAPGILVINEVLAHSDIGQDWIELRNTSSNNYAIGGWFLSDDGAQLAKYRIPDGTVITAGSYRVFTELDFNSPTNPAALVPFALSELGDDVHFSSGSAGVPTDYRESVSFGASDQNVTLGRFARCDGLVDFTTLSAPTPGAANAYPLVGPVVFSELMYNPGTGGTEYVELRNISGSPVPLFDPLRPTNVWKITSGVDYAFPTNQTLSAGGYALVVPVAPGLFRTNYFIPANIPVYGPYTGSLDNAGETVRLRRPGLPEPALVPYLVVEELTYDDVAPWPLAADGTGPALERIEAYGYGNDACNWRASNPAGSPGTLPQLDANGNGIPDSWEMVVLGSTNAPADFDGDGLPNLAEYVLGSDATSSGSVFRLDLSTSNGLFLVRFPTWPAQGPGYYGRQRWYALERADDLPGTWTPVAGYDAVPGDTGGVVQVETAPSTQRYFRVRAWMNP